MSLKVEWLAARKGEDPIRYLDDVYRYAIVRLGNREDAEDLAIEVVQSLPSPCFKSDLRLYMLGMARRKIASQFRRRRHRLSMRESDRPIRFDEASDEAALVHCAMARLIPEHREVLSLKYVSGLTSNEIGTILRKRPEAVDSMLQRARAAFEQTWLLITSDEVKQ
ncbi:MAG: RNA polymerase sigma factor [Fimbriimonas sp.]|nr:RNA polymerase sigma factor [Fimbriimonas sp.]